MNIFIRADASEHIGSGHIMRCLVLAEDLRANKANVTFVCRELPGNLIDYIEDKGFSVIVFSKLPQAQSNSENELNWLEINWKTDANQTMNAIKRQSGTIDWLIVDHYAIDEKWEQTIKPLVRKIMVIDDLANRSHDCDLFLDQNLYRDLEKRYENLLPENTTTLLGPKYTLLRREFSNFKRVSRRNGLIKRILISFGGSDPTNETMKALRAINLISQPDITVDVVVGFSNQNYLSIKKLCKMIPNLQLHYNIDYLSELMADADVAIGAGGGTTWERCYVGLPAITIETAENQSEFLSFLSQIGAICHLGISQKVSEVKIANSLRKLIMNPNAVKKMAEVSSFIMKDHKSCLVTEKLLGEHNK